MCGHGSGFSAPQFVLRLPPSVRDRAFIAPFNGCGMCAVVSALQCDVGAIASDARDFLVSQGLKRRDVLRAIADGRDTGATSAGK